MDNEDETLFSADEEDIDNSINSDRVDLSYNSRDNLSNLVSSIWKVFTPNIWQIKNSIQSETEHPSPMFDGEDNSCRMYENSLTTNMNANPNMCRCMEFLSFPKKLICWTKRFFTFIIWILIQTLRIVQRIIMFIIFLLIFLITLPFIILINFVLFLKCYTNSKYMIYIPFKLIPTIIYHIWTLLRKLATYRWRRPTQRCSQDNVNNNVRITNSFNGRKWISKILKITNRMTVPKLSLFIAGLLIVFVLFSFANPTLKKCNKKLLINSNLRSIYMLPGEKCMKAGKCCNGYLESIFRWFSCFITLPLRSLLFLWHKTNNYSESNYDVLGGVQNYINEVMKELHELKEEIKHQDEVILNIKSNFMDLHQNIYEKVKFIDQLKPRVLNLQKAIEEMRNDLELSILSLKDINTVLQDVDKIHDSTKIENNNAKQSAKLTISRLKDSIEAEQHQLKSQIENIEILLQNDQKRTNDKNEKTLLKISSEIDKIKISYNDIKKRILSVVELPSTLKQMSSGIHQDLRKKVDEEIMQHEQINKKTERSCGDQIDKLGNDYRKVKADLSCFTIGSVRNEANSVKNKLKKDISDSLNERTHEMAKSISEKALSKQETYNKPNEKVKKCCLFEHAFKLKFESDDCLIKDKSESLALCNTRKPDKSSFGQKEMKDKVDVLISDAIRVLDADDIGITDYALESSGGSVISDRSSPTYTGRAAFLSVFGFTFGKIVKSLRKVIQPGALPGECWAFRYSKGHVVIRLAKPIVISAITLDHVSKKLTPDGQIRSAPKNFILYSLSSYDDYVGIKLGEFEYSKEGDPIQTFTLIKSSLITQYIQVEFISNHGNEEYTCIYRIRIHGNFSGSI